jgi:hypothetical protein
METMLIDEKSSLELRFDQGEEVLVFDQTHTKESISRKVIISNNTKVRWYGVVSGDSNYSLLFETQSGESVVRMLLLATNNEQLKTTVYSTLANSHTITNIHILSLV